MFVSCVLSEKEMLLPLTGCKLFRDRPLSAANEHLPSLTKLMGANITTLHWREALQLLVVTSQAAQSQCSSPWTHEHKSAENEADE